MPKLLLKALPIFILVFIVQGCTSTKDIKVRAYKKDKQRVDQEISGVVGNWQGAPAAEDPDRKPTKKVYYLEFTKDAPGTDVDVDAILEDVEKQVDKTYVPKNVSRTGSEGKVGSKISLPSFDDEEAVDVPTTVTGVTSYEEYTVRKDDTLQKISKKFYNSFSKWPRIYEANKAKIKSPDFIEPGLVIRIPMD